MYENPVVWEFGAFCTHAIAFERFPVWLHHLCAHADFPLPSGPRMALVACGLVALISGMFYQIFFFFWSRIDQWTSHMPSLWFPRGWLRLCLGLRSDLCHSVSCQCFCFFAYFLASDKSRWTALSYLAFFPSIDFLFSIEKPFFAFIRL